nr:MAG TPA: hypothetical protein [Caudoviricetes sp.]
MPTLDGIATLDTYAVMLKCQTAWISTLTESTATEVLHSTTTGTSYQLPATILGSIVCT